MLQLASETAASQDVEGAKQPPLRDPPTSLAKVNSVLVKGAVLMTMQSQHLCLPTGRVQLGQQQCKFPRPMPPVYGASPQASGTARPPTLLTQAHFTPHRGENPGKRPHILPTAPSACWALGGSNYHKIQPSRLGKAWGSVRACMGRGQGALQGERATGSPE